MYDVQLNWIFLHVDIALREPERFLFEKELVANECLCVTLIKENLSHGKFFSFTSSWVCSSCASFFRH